MRYLLLIVLFIGIQNKPIFGQNLVPNGDFEIYSTLPNSSGDWAFCTGWNNVNLNSGSWPYATPDYFHTSGTGGGKIPNTAFGAVTAQSGNAIIGLYSRHSSQLNSRDYMSTQLSSPLVVGTTYTISFWMTNGYGSYFYGSSCSHMGIQLSMAPLTQVNHENTGGTPQVEVPGDPWLPNWTFYSFTYVATSPFQYVTIGNFNNDATTTTTLHNAGANYPSGAYYFFDDVRIEATIPLSIELLAFTAENKSDYVQTNWETNTELNNDYFTLERSDDLTQWMEIGKVAGAGTSVDPQNYEYRDYEPLSGVSYYRLKQTDYDGASSYSEVRAVERDYLESEIYIYPIPSRDNITVEGRWEVISEFQLIDALGRDLSTLVGSKKGERMNSLILDISSLPCGVYFFTTRAGMQRISKM